MQLEKWGRIAERQYGLITREQALEIATQHALAHAIRNNTLEIVRQGVYRMHGSPPTWHQQLMAVVLSHPKYVVSHRAAARLHGLGNHWSHELLELSTGQTGRHSLTGVVIHKAPLIAHHVTTIDGLRVTSVARTLVDIAATSHEATMQWALDHALRRKLVRLDHLDAVVSEISRPGRPKMAKVRKLIAARRENLTHSDLERDVLAWIGRARLTTPLSQYPVETDLCTYHLDLAYPDFLVGIEADGFVAHGDRTAFDDDARRNSAIAAQGWRILHVTTRTRNWEFIRDLRLALRGTPSKRGARSA